MIYDINIPGIFEHRIHVNHEDRVTEPLALQKLGKNFFDWRHHFAEKPFSEFLAFLKHEYRNKRISVTEVTDDAAGDPGEHDQPTIDKSGLMVAFFLPAEIAEEMTVEGGEEPEEMHLTLVFSGPLATLPPGSVEKACAAVAEFVKGRAPISGHVTGTGRFNGTAGSPTGGKDALYASFSSPELAKFREALVAKLEAIGLGPKTQFGYTPHITLKYLDADEESPVGKQPRHDVVFDTITVASGPHRHDYKLGSESSAPVSDSTA
jgi:2'-5' RNA ligase